MLDISPRLPTDDMVSGKNTVRAGTTNDLPLSNNNILIINIEANCIGSVERCGLTLGACRLRGGVPSLLAGGLEGPNGDDTPLQFLRPRFSRWNQV